MFKLGTLLEDEVGVFLEIAKPANVTGQDEIRRAFLQLKGVVAILQMKI